MEKATPKKKATTDATQVQVSRTNMALLHFVMTWPKWSVSLMIFLAARQSSLQSPREAVQEPIERLQTALDMESRSYRQCVLDSAVEIQLELETVAQIENDRVAAIHQANKLVIEKARQQKEKCFDSASKAQTLLRQWHDSGNAVSLVQDPRVCSDDQRVNMERLLGGDYQLLEQEVTSLWEQQFQDSLRGFRLIQNYAEARFQYDYDYFVGRRIQPALDLINALKDVESPDLSMAGISEALLGIQDALHRAEMIIEALKKKILQLSVDLEAFYQAYSDIYERLMNAAAFVKDILPPGVPIPSFFDFSVIPIADSIMPSFSDMRDLGLDIDSIYPLLNEIVQVCTETLQEVINDLIAQSKLALTGTIKKIVTALTSVLQLEDYDPPVFVGSQGSFCSLADEVASQASLGRSVLARTKTLLANVSSVEIRNEGTKEWNVPLETGEDSLPDRSTTFAYLRPMLPSLFFPKALALLLSVASTTTWIFEIIIHAFRLWKLEEKYNKAAVPDLPEITFDTSMGGEPNGSDGIKARQMILSMLLKTSLVPRILIIVIFVPVVFGVVALWYPHVKANCEESRNGTFLANRFIVPIVVNEANSLGNAYYLKAELQCVQTERQICQQMQAHTLTRYQADYSTLSGLLSEFTESVQVVEIMKDCVESSTTVDIEDSCCGIKNFSPCGNFSDPGFCPTDNSEELEMSFNPLRQYLWEPACSVESSQLDLLRPQFECEKLVNICAEIPCEGVDKVTLTEETIETDCQVELFGLRLVFFVCLVLYHAVVLNLVSTLLFKGIRILRWRTLHPDGMYFRTKMSEDGSLSEGYCQQDRADRISIAIRRFEFAGKLQLFIGTVVFIIWAILIFL